MNVHIKRFIAVSCALRGVYAAIFLLAGLSLPCRAAVSVNLPPEDPAYALFDKLVTRGLTFRNALTVKPITRLYAAQLLAESLQQRRREWDASKRRDRFLDQTLQYLAGRFKRELRAIGAFYQPLRPGPLYWSPWHEVKLDVIAASEAVLPRALSEGSLQEGFVPGGEFTLRLRGTSWGTFREQLAVYIEPELIIRTDPLVALAQDRLDASLHQGYLKIGYANLELTFGRDALWWGPAAFGDLASSRDAPRFDLVKVSHPFPFRLPGALGHLGDWHMAAFAAYAGRGHETSHTIQSGLRVTLQPTSYLQIGYTHMWQFSDHEDAPNGLGVVDVVLNLPFLRLRPVLHGVRVYWQHGYDYRHGDRVLLTGGNIVGSLIDGGRWDIRFEYAETGDAADVGGDAGESYRARIRYYVTPTYWVAADGRYERNRRQRSGGAVTQPPTNRQHIGLEMSYSLNVWKQTLRFGGRLEFARLEVPSSDLQQALYVYMKIAIRRQ